MEDSIRELAALKGIAIGSNVPPCSLVIGDDLLRIHDDGTVDGRLEDMGEAARVFVEFVRGHLAMDLNRVLADAWDEGATAQDLTYTSERPLNPYREQTND
ncbi:hypothetical protein ACSBPH_01495 [Microbacterium sp. F51-2R]|uniref:hypothetical protein n=1 Tax=Microbacterium sp. F51-2R TaxID=3445777 RepID=UPI003F9F3A90